MRAVLLAIVATIAFAGGVASTAGAKTTSNQPVLVAVAGPSTSATNDPSDPGLPPD